MRIYSHELSNTAKQNGDSKMSKVMNAIIDGAAKEFQAMVHSVKEVRFIVEFNNKFYIENMGRFIQISKNKFTKIDMIESSLALQ